MNTFSISGQSDLYFNFDLISVSRASKVEKVAQPGFRLYR